MNLIRTLCIGLILLIGLAGVGCNKAAEKASEAAAEKAIEAASGGEVDVDYSGETVTMTDKETGMTSEVTAGAESMPEGWPANLPQYPASEIEAVQTIKQAGGVMLMVNLKSADSGDKVAAFYAEKATAAGFTEASKFTIPEGGQTQYESAGQVFGVVYTIEEGATFIALSLMPKP